jgi:hypothetical protein
MTIHWSSLLEVFAVSLISTLAVVALVALALIGLSARTPVIASPGRHPLSGPARTTLAAACLAAAVGIVLFGLWEIVAR